MGGEVSQHDQRFDADAIAPPTPCEHECRKQLLHAVFNLGIVLAIVFGNTG